MAGRFLDLLRAKQMASCRVRCRHVNNKLDAQWIISCTFIEQLEKKKEKSPCAAPISLSRVTSRFFQTKASGGWFCLTFTRSRYNRPEEFSPLCAHLLLLPPASDCVVSAHWDMLFGLIYNASPAPGHHVWQMTYFCADPHRALTWRDGWVRVQLCVNQCMFVFQWVSLCCSHEDKEVVE